MNVPTNFERVYEFHQVFGVPIREQSGFPDFRRTELRLSLIDEEYDELKDALREGDIMKVADGLADMIYVLYGTGLEFGIQLDWVLQEVHRSNMSKLGKDGKPVRREDGKILKGPNFTPPDIAGVLIDGSKKLSETINEA